MDINSEAGRRRTAPANRASGLFRDIKLAWRGIIRAPGFATIAVASLAIAIGGNTAMFSLIEAFILRTPPYAEPEELVDISLAGPAHDIGFSYSTFRHMVSATKEIFDGVAGTMFNRVHVSDESGRYGSSLHELVAGPYFQVLGVQAQVGRVFTPDEGVVMGADPLVVLSDEYWRRTFDGDPAVVGREVSLNSFPFTIVGVAAPGFSGVVPGIRSAFWTPATMANQIYVTRPGRLDALEQTSLLVVGRLAAGVTLSDAETAVQESVDSDQFDSHPGADSEHRIAVTPILASAVHPALDGIVLPVVTTASGVLAVLLLLASINLATLFLARAEARRHEFAVYVALGTCRVRIVRRFLAETTMVALLGGVVGVCLSVVLLEAIGTLQLPIAPPLTVDNGLNTTVLLFAIGLSLLAGLLMGLGSSIWLARTGVTTTLGEERSGGSRIAARARNALLVTQVALTTILVVAGGAYALAWFIALQQDPGFGKHPAAVASLALGPDRPEDERRGFYDAYLRRLADIPEVVSAGAVTVLPLQVHLTSLLGIRIPGVDPPPGGGRHVIDWAAVAGDYFDATGIPLLAGRSFNSGDDRTSPTVAIVSETMAERFWPDQDPVGKTLDVCEGCWVTVVGVVGDIKVGSLSEAPRPVIYTRMAQSPYYNASFVARTTADPASLIPAMRTLGAELDSAVNAFSLMTLEQHVSVSLMPLRIPAILLGAIGGLALFLAAIGVYGIVSYTVAARKRELAIRMSLGANPKRLATAVLRSAMKLIAAGLVAGLLLTVVVERALRETPYPLKPFDPVDFSFSAALLAGIGMLAAYLSVRRAIRLYPMYALKDE